MESPAQDNPLPPKPKRLANSTKVFIFSLLAGFLFFPSLFFLVRSLMSDAESERRFAAFRSVVIGMPRAQVVELLGSGGRTLEKFALGQSGGYEYEYAAAERSGAKTWLKWIFLLDLHCTVGFDENDRVIFKADGST